METQTRVLSYTAVLGVGIRKVCTVWWQTLRPFWKGVRITLTLSVLVNGYTCTPGVGPGIS